MNILYVLPGLQVAGGIRIAIEHMNRLKARGHNVCVTPTDRITKCDWLQLDAEIIHPMVVDERDWEVMVATEASTWHWVDQAKAQRKYGLLQMKEWYFYREGVRDQVKSWFTLPLIPITISNWLKEWLEEHHDLVHLIPNGVNFDHFYPEPFDSPFIRADKPIILIEGRELTHEPDSKYIEAKNTRDAHAVCDRLKKEGYEFLKWGFSQDQAEADRWEWDQFWFIPAQEMIRKIYSTAGASGGFLLKTTQYEGRNCTVVEAMACKCPVIATHCGGVDDLHHRGTCFLASYGDVDTLTDCADEMLESARITPSGRDMSMHEIFSEQAYRYVHRNLNWDNIIPTLESILTDPSNVLELPEMDKNLYLEEILENG